MDEATTLYRMFDGSGTLLYVGITSRLPERIAEHQDGKPWWSNVANVTVEHYPSRDEALAAEAAAILTENPVHNIVRPLPRQPGQPGVTERITAREATRAEARRLRVAISTPVLQVERTICDANGKVTEYSVSLLPEGCEVKLNGAVTPEMRTAAGEDPRFW